MFCDRVIRDTSPAKRPAVATGSQSNSLMSHSFDRRSLVKELAAKGVRLTSQRRVLIEIIQDAEEHLDAAALGQLAQQRGVPVDRATVYRTVELLKKHRLIDELDLMHLQGEKHYYEVKTRRDHIHLACFRCQRIVEFASPAFEKLKAEMARQTGFDLRVTRLEVGGLCPECRAAGEQQPVPTASSQPAGARV